MHVCSDRPNMRRSPNVVLMLEHRLRHWSNINTTLGERLVFARDTARSDVFVV